MTATGAGPSAPTTGEPSQKRPRSLSAARPRSTSATRRAHFTAEGPATADEPTDGASAAALSDPSASLGQPPPGADTRAPATPITGTLTPGAPITVNDADSEAKGAEPDYDEDMDGRIRGLPQCPARLPCRRHMGVSDDANARFQGLEEAHDALASQVNELHHNVSHLLGSQASLADTVTPT